MAYRSLRTIYPSLQVAPPDLRVLFTTMRRGRARFLLSLLIDRPAEVMVGQYRWRTGLVYLSPRAREVAELNGMPLEVPYPKMGAAVHSLRIWLKQRGLKIGASRRCEAGVGCRGYRYTKEVTPFTVGLVDRRERLAGAVSNGGGR